MTDKKVSQKDAVALIKAAAAKQKEQAQQPQAQQQGVPVEPPEVVSVVRNCHVLFTA